MTARGRMNAADDDPQEVSLPLRHPSDPSPSSPLQPLTLFLRPLFDSPLLLVPSILSPTRSPHPASLPPSLPVISLLSRLVSLLVF